MSLVRTEYISEEFTRKFSEAFHGKKEFSDKHTGAYISHVPFTHCVLPSIVDNGVGGSLLQGQGQGNVGNVLIERVRKELLEDNLIEFSEKWNDLHDFYQCLSKSTVFSIQLQNTISYYR